MTTENNYNALVVYTVLIRLIVDNIYESKIIIMNINNKQTINDLKNFYIDHMIEIYNHDWDKFWEDHEDIIELEYELTNNN